MGHKHQSQNAESYVKFLVNNFILMRLMHNCVLHFSRGIYIINMVIFDLMLTTHAQIRVDSNKIWKTKVTSYLGKLKHHSRRQNKANEIIRQHYITRYYNLSKYRYKQNQYPPPPKKNVFRYVKLTDCCLKLDFQNVDQHAGGKRLIQGAKHLKGNRLQHLELQCRISQNCENKFDIDGWKIVHPWWSSNSRSRDYLPSFIDSLHVSDRQSYASQICFYINQGPQTKKLYTKMIKNVDGRYPMMAIWILRFREKRRHLQLGM